MKDEYFKRLVAIMQRRESHVAWVYGVILGTADRTGTEPSEALLDRAESVRSFAEAQQLIDEAILSGELYVGPEPDSGPIQ